MLDPLSSRVFAQQIYGDGAFASAATKAVCTGFGMSDLASGGRTQLRYCGSHAGRPFRI